MNGDRIDWFGTSAAERRGLSKPVNELRRKLGLSWKELFEQALGDRDNVGADYQDNLRRGRIAPEKAWKLFDWLAAHDEGIAASVTAAIIAPRSAASPAAAPTWGTLLSTCSFMGVRAVKIVPSLSALEFARRQPVSPVDLALMDQFVFEIDAPIAGRVTAFHGRRGQWSQLPMSQASPTVRIKPGTVLLPMDDKGGPDPLREDEEAGEHSFVFVTLAADKNPLPKLRVAPGRTLRPELLDQIAQAVIAVPEDQRHIVRINLIFKSRPSDR